MSSASVQSSVQSLLTVGVLCSLGYLYLQRRRGTTRRAAIEIGKSKTRMLVADVDYAGLCVVKEVHSREIRHSAARALEDVVRALVAEARDVGAAQATVYERSDAAGGSAEPRRDASAGPQGGAKGDAAGDAGERRAASVLKRVEDRWRKSSCDSNFDLNIVDFLAKPPLWLASASSSASGALLSPKAAS